MCLGILSNGAAGPRRYECVAHQPWDKASSGNRTNDFTMGLYIFLPFFILMPRRYRPFSTNGLPLVQSTSLIYKEAGGSGGRLF